MLKSVEMLVLDSLENAPSVRYGHTSSIVGDQLYVFGGSDGKTFFNQLRVLDLVKMKWVDKVKETPEEIVGRHFHTCVYMSKWELGGNKLIFFGGKSNGYLDDLFVYDLKKEIFEKKKPKLIAEEKSVRSCVNKEFQPPSPRYGHSACYYRKKMYVFGGYDKNGFVKNDLYRFDLRTNQWKKFVIAQMNKRFHHSGVLMDNGNYFILGGIQNNYKPLSDIFRIDLNIRRRRNGSDEENEGELDEREEEEEEVEAFQLSCMNEISSYGHFCFFLDGHIYQYGGRNENEEIRKLCRLENHHGNYRWKEVDQHDNNNDLLKKLVLSSYCTINVYKNKKILFFGGQQRKNPSIIVSEKNKNQKNEDIISRLSYDSIFVVLSYLTINDYITLSSLCKSKSCDLCRCARSDRIWGPILKKKRERGEFFELQSFRETKIRRAKTMYEKYRIRKIEELKRRKFLKNLEDSKQKKLIRNQMKRILFGSNLSMEDMNFKEYEVALKEEDIKVVFIGDGAVGKTSMIIRMATGDFNRFDYLPTVFDNHSFENMSFSENLRTNIQVWDTAGEEDYDQLRPLSYPRTKVFVICFSLVSPASYSNVSEKWIEEVKRNENMSFGGGYKGYSIILCGTKKDLTEHPRSISDLKEVHKRGPITTKEGEKLAKKISANVYVETSALLGHNIDNNYFLSLIVYTYMKHRFGKFVDPKMGKKKEDQDGKCGIM